MHTTTGRVVPLQEMTAFDVAEGDPDVRGWDVVSAEGVRVGVVDDLLVDVEAMKVRYLEVDLGLSFRNGQGMSHVLIPLSCTRLDETADRVTVDGLDLDSVATLPRFDGALSPDLEQRLLDRFENRTTGSFDAHMPPRPGELI